MQIDRRIFFICNSLNALKKIGAIEYTYLLNLFLTKTDETRITRVFADLLHAFFLSL